MSTLEQNQKNPTSSEALKEHPIVFFDGVCGLCNHSIDFIIKRDKKHLYRFAPLQGETAKECLSPEQVENLNNIVLLDETGEYHKSAATVRILQNLNLLWPLCGTLLWLIPKPIRDFGYSLVAKYRYQMFGKHESCRIPKPEEAELFLP